MKKYQVIYDLYKESILSGILKYGDRVDSIRECVKKMNVSKTTVENAYNKLVLDGFMSRKSGVCGEYESGAYLTASGNPGLFFESQRKIV